MDREPIFFAWTRSFWLGWAPALLTLVDVLVQLLSDPNAETPVAAAVAALLGLGVALWNALPLLPDIGWQPTAAHVLQGMKAFAPVYAIIVAQQRGGAARPYTADPRARR
jgi:hypothetical protein